MSIHEDLGGDLQRSLSTSDEVTGGSESIVWPVWGGSERLDSRSALWRFRRLLLRKL